MKKLMIALAVVAMGVAANAASFSWSAQSGRLMDGSGNSGSDYYIKSGSAYLVFASALTQSDLVTAFASDAATAMSTVASKSVSTGTIGSDARVASKSFTADVSANQNAYFVVFNADKMYVSIETTAEYWAVGESPVEFGSITASSKLTHDASAGYSAAGWYQAAAVPEPTSGLLMLLGMAGLALRRKRA